MDEDSLSLIQDSFLRYRLHVPASFITVYSLATSLAPWENPPTRVATLMFKETPPFLPRATSDESEWQTLVTLSDKNYILVLDHHFWGMTPLNDVPKESPSAEYEASNKPL
ncbi:hypothetical protein CP532_1082 [Ophiocordyceps camponoti-leonardi (nom. inval.)]|nr:hypothetical protein CP532_1082 [Ophiocordyceps camponoti-leonardi (nom. inval.)]